MRDLPPPPHSHHLHSMLHALLGMDPPVRPENTFTRAEWERARRARRRAAAERSRRRREAA